MFQTLSFALAILPNLCHIIACFGKIFCTVECSYKLSFAFLLWFCGLIMYITRGLDTVVGTRDFALYFLGVLLPHFDRTCIVIVACFL